MPPSGDQLQLQRQALRRGLWRASLASIVVLLVVVALAIGVAWKAEQFHVEAGRARVATARAESELWNSKLNEARARRIAGGPGARVESAALVRELVNRSDLGETQQLALRQEAIAQLALVDVEIGTNWIRKKRADRLSWNETLTQYVQPHTDGGRVVLSSYPGGEVVRVFQAPDTNAVLSLAVFNSKGDLLAGRFRDGQVCVWRIEDGALLLSTRGTSDDRNYDYPFFSRDGGTVGILSASAARSRGEGLRLYDAYSGQVQARLSTPATHGQFSPDDEYLALIADGGVKVINLASNTEVAALSQLDFTPTAISWAADGTRLAISGDSVGRLVVWEVWSPAKPRALVGHPNKIVALSFSPTIPMVLTYGWDSMANFWEPISGRRLLAENRVPVFRFSADGSKVLTAIDDGWREAVQPFLAPNGFRTVASTGKAAEPTEGVWLHPRGQLLAAAYHASKGVRLYRFPHGGEIAGLPGYWAQFTRDGNALLTFARDAVRRYEIPVEFSGCGTDAEWRERVIYRPGAGREISKGTVGPDDKTLVIGEGDCAVLFDLAGERELGRFKEYAQNGSLSANGQWLATSIHQAAGGLLKVSTGEKLLPIPPRSWAEFSPDGRYLLVLDGRALRFYKTNTWERVRRIPLEVGAGTSPGVCFAPDGQMLAVAYNRQEVRLYETASGRELATLSPPNPVPIAGGAGLAFSSDARWLIAARNDGDIVAWELPVIRTELAKLGLDWGNKDLKTPTAVIASIPAIRFPSPQTAAFLAALFAIGAGTFIFLMQRRMIAGYERVEAITLAQREKLETAQDELVHGQKMRALGTLAAGIAHDFNNLLSVIRLSNQLAAEETKPTGAARENMEAVESAVAQGETIVQSMLGYSRAAGETDKEYSVAAALSETVAMLGKKFLSGIVLKLEVAPDLPLVQGARGRLEQMLLNLVVNAAEAMKGHGTLRLAAQTVSSYADCVLKPRPATSYIEVLVSDSGPGIPEEILPRIFEPFFTTKNAGATPGTGLGLSTVYAMAEQDGLGLGVETSQHGTTFRIVIPVGATSPVIGDRIQHNIGI